MELIFSDKFFYKIILLKNIDKNNIYHNIYNKGVVSRMHDAWFLHRIYFF